MWRANGKTNTLILFLDSVFPKTEVMCETLLPENDLKEARRYWKLKEEAQDRTLWRTQFGRDYGPVARQTTTLKKKYVSCSKKRMLLKKK
jgi:hypothetical protein